MLEGLSDLLDGLSDLLKDLSWPPVSLFSKHSRQNTGLLEVGLKGTSQSLPQEAHVTLVILMSRRSLPFRPPLLLFRWLSSKVIPSPSELLRREPLSELLFLFPFLCLSNLGIVMVKIVSLYKGMCKCWREVQYSGLRILF